MASIKRRSDRGGRWEVRYRDPAGKQRARLFERKVDAERFAATTAADLLRGTYVDPAGGRCMFGDYARTWAESQVHRATTSAQVESNLRNHILPTFAARPLAAVRPSEVQSWVKGRTEVLAPSTVEVIYRYVAAIFASAVDDRLIVVTPCKGVKLPKVEAPEVVPLATEAVEALIDAMPERYRAAVVLAAGTGLRQGEVFGLTTDHLDFLRRSLRVDQQLVLLPRRPPYLAPPKTKASRRTIPLPDVVLEELAAHLAVFPVGEGDSLVFTNDKGEGIRRNRFSESVWVPAVARAGVPGAHFHDLRHYYASLLIRHGESVKVVQARLGHASASETLDTYSHLWPDSEDRTRAAVDAVLRSRSSRAEAARTGSI
ncbi:MAG: tyrosine-type recombinase/integrase [Acidimicrobiales bacterium]